MSQNDLQNTLWQQRGNLQIKAELCNVLYERELARLAKDPDITLVKLKRTMLSLPFYIGRAAENIVNTYSPLDLDSSNASWLSRQSPQPFSVKANAEKTFEFYQNSSQIALVVPISIDVYGIECVVLDSIDEIDAKNNRVHCNQHGWFNYDGSELDPISGERKLLLKPGKPVMSAACCGHQWKNLQKNSARALSLRELLLATRVNWHNFSKLVAAK